jgi:hypothetical protein
MKKFNFLFIVFFFFLLAPSLKAQDILMIDDFNDGEKPNNLGGDYGSWEVWPEDETQGCIESIVASRREGDMGLCLRLDYDVDSPNEAYNGFWTKLMYKDISEYKYVVFWAKGDADRGFTTEFFIELWNTNQENMKYKIRGVTDSWQQFKINFDDFETRTRKPIDLTEMESFVITFDDENATVKEGTIYIDDIYLSTE